MIVEIPIISEHEGMPCYIKVVEISDNCPQCNAKRGVQRWRDFSYDGSRRIIVDCWKNACGHIDRYADVAKEGKIIEPGSLRDLELQLGVQSEIYATSKDTIKANNANFEMMILMEKIKKLKGIQ